MQGHGIKPMKSSARLLSNRRMADASAQEILKVASCVRRHLFLSAFKAVQFEVKLFV